jgi:hypothetical protein
VLKNEDETANHPKTERSNLIAQQTNANQQSFLSSVLCHNAIFRSKKARCGTFDNREIRHSGGINARCAVSAHSARKQIELVCF